MPVTPTTTSPLAAASRGPLMMATACSHSSVAAVTEAVRQPAIEWSMAARPTAMPQAHSNIPRWTAMATVSRSIGKPRTAWTRPTPRMRTRQRWRFSLESLRVPRRFESKRPSQSPWFRSPADDTRLPNGTLSGLSQSHGNPRVECRFDLLDHPPNDHTCRHCPHYRSDRPAARSRSRRYYRVTSAP